MFKSFPPFSQLAAAPFVEARSTTVERGRDRRLGVLGIAVEAHGG